MTDLFKAIWCGFAALGCAATIVPVSLMAAPLDNSDIVLVVAPPWSQAGGAARIVEDLNGQVVGPTSAPFGVLAVLEAPDMARGAGAWMVLNGAWIAQVCGVSADQQKGIG